MQFIDLKAQYEMLKIKIDATIHTVPNEAQFINVRQIIELESEMAEYSGIKNMVSFANGTDALQLLYMSYNIGAGDAVFCPDITFTASVESAAMLGASPVFCDISPNCFNLCPKSLEMQIKSVLKEGNLTPRAVVAVDFPGNSAEYGEISAICDKYGLISIEDDAQSFGARIL